MNERAQACLRKAEECEHSAQRTGDESARLLYLDLANHWRILAAHVETMDRQRNTLPPKSARPPWMIESSGQWPKYRGMSSCRLKSCPMLT